MRIGVYRIDADWGHVTFTTAVIAACVAYLLDARSVSTNIQNLLLLTPAVALAVLLYIIIIVQELRLVRADVREEAPREREPLLTRLRLSRLQVPVAMALLGLYVWALPVAGFDVATFFFVASMLAIQGERRPIFLFGFSAVFAAVIAWGTQKLLPYGIPTTLI